MAETILTSTSSWIAVTLAADEREALRLLAFQEGRTVRTQAALIIRRELTRQGLLAAAGTSSPPAAEFSDES